MRNFAVALALVQACAVTVAQGTAAAPPDSRAATHICGGVSQDDAQEMKAQARQHDLMLTFAESNGSFLADVEVEIRDSRGSLVLSVQCEGPIMLVDLPPGRWRITARTAGQTRQQSITTARGRTARATLVWPAAAS